MPKVVSLRLISSYEANGDSDSDGDGDSDGDSHQPNVVRLRPKSSFGYLFVTVTISFIRYVIMGKAYLTLT